VNNGPIIHIHTKNLSFIKMYHILKDLGVINNKFFLILFDHDLQFIDPYDPDLTLEQKSKVIRECKRNYWYFIREVLLIDSPGGKARFNLHRGNLALAWSLLNNINTYCELPRQCTKSGTAASFYGWLYSFGTTNSKMSFTSRGEQSVKQNLKDVKAMLSNLPDYLNFIDLKKDIDNTERIEHKEFRNSIEINLPANSQEQSLNKGRGLRQPIQWFDEFPFTAYIKDAFLVSSSSWWESAQQAARNNAYYHRLTSSTPGILGTASGDWVHDVFLPQTAQFDESLYDMPINKVKEYVYSQSKNDFLYIRFYYQQLGKGQDYYLSQCRTLQNDREAIDREVNLRWSHRSAANPFKREQLDKIFENVKTPVGTLMIQEHYVLKFFRKPDYNKQYVISVDCSAMVADNNDYSSIILTDPDDFGVVATLRTNQRTHRSNTTRFTYAIIDIATKIFKNALLVVEKNNMGIAIIDNIITMRPDLEERMYSSRREPNTKDVDDVEKSFDNRPVYGFDTTNNTRSQMFSELIKLVVEELYDVIHDVDIYSEINSIVRNKKGKLEHKCGKHDDLLLAYLIGLWVLVYSKSLHKYNFDVTRVRSMSIIDADKKEEYTTPDVNENIIFNVIQNARTNNIKGQMAMDLFAQEYHNDPIVQQIQKTKVMNLSGNQIADMMYENRDDGEDYDSVEIDEYSEDIEDVEVDYESEILNKKADRTRKNNLTDYQDKQKIKKAIIDSEANISTSHLDELF